MNTLHDGVIYLDSHDEVGNHDGKRTIEKAPRKRAMMGSVLKFLVPGQPMMFMGEEYGEKSPFYFIANYSDPACIQGVREGRKNSPQPDCLDESTFQASKLSWKKDPGIESMNRDAIRLRQSIPALWQGDQREMTLDERYLGSGVINLHRRGREDKDSEVLIVMNTSSYDYRQQYNFRFPPGEWEEIFSTEDIAYGNSGMTNQGKSFSGEAPITLMGSSISVFQKKTK